MSKFDAFSDPYRKSIKTIFKNVPNLTDEEKKLCAAMINTANSNGGGVYKASLYTIEEIINKEEVSLADLKRFLQGYSYLPDRTENIDKLKEIIKERVEVLEQERNERRLFDRILNEQDIAKQQIQISLFAMVAAVCSAIAAVCMVVLEILKY
jgi:hypothetical protein